MGEVYKPEDIVSGKRKSTDLSPRLNQITTSTLQDVIREIRLLKTEVENIKRVLKERGIVVEGNR